MATKIGMEINGDKLRRLRKQRLLTIGALADLSGVHRNQISWYEHGTSGAHPTTIRKLAEALEVDPAELVGD